MTAPTRRVRRALLGAVAALLLSPVPFATPVHAASVLAVPGAYPTIQAAIDAAQDGDTVVVAPGTYGPIDFKGKAVTVESTAGPALTTIDAAYQAVAVTFISGERSGSVLQGFTITHGAPHSTGVAGGGVNIESSSPTIVGNIITANTACGGNGLAVFGAATIENNWISGNSSPGCGGSIGGGISVGGQGARITGNVITGNSADAGGGMEMNGSDALVRGNIITSNRSGSQGGGIDIINLSPATIVDNLIAYNSAVSGGGIESLTPYGTPGPVVAGNTIAYNTVTGTSGPTGAEVVASGFAESLQLTDNILVTDAAFPALYCDATWDSTPPAVTSNDIVSPQSPSAGVCSAQTGTGNISADPLFVQTGSASDLHLRAGSPAIDAGTTSAALGSADLDGDPRIVNAAPDLGAYEWSSSSPLPTELTLTSAPTASFSIGTTLMVAVAPKPAAGGTAQLTTPPTVTFDGTPPPGCSVLTAASGWATCAIRLTSIGTHRVDAAFGGASSYGASTAELTLDVAQGTTSTTLSTSSNPGGAGQPIQLTAQVDFSSDQGSHAGTVSFTADGSPIDGCSAEPMNAGVATCSVTYTVLGGHQISASYSGSADFAASTSSTLDENVGWATTTGVSVTPSSSIDGQSVTITASVDPGAARGTPTGTVAFVDAGAPVSGCAAVALSGTTVTCTVALAAGAHPLIATYSGDATFGSSTSPTAVQTVTPLSTSVSLASSPTSTYAGSDVVLSVVVSGMSPDTAPPTGQVVFSDGSASLGSAPLDATGHVQFVPPTLPTGTRSITATYTGDAHNATSSTTIQVQILPLIPTEVTIATSSSPSVPGQRVWLGIAVDTPDGSLDGIFQVSVNHVVQGTGGLDADGTRSFELDSLPTGTDTITVAYLGDRSHYGSSASLSQYVGAASPDQRFVNQLFNDILGRDADSGTSAWAQALDTANVTRTQVALALTTSTEFLTDQIQAEYLVHLGRSADPKGLQFWIGYLRKGATFEDLEISFLSTPEYYAHAGGSPEPFLHTLYGDVLGRDIDPGGLEYWAGKLTTGTPFWVVAASVVKSTEAMSNRVTADYALLLGRDPDKVGLANWVSTLQHGTRDETLLGFLAGSDEYWNLTQSY